VQILIVPTSDLMCMTSPCGYWTLVLHSERFHRLCSAPISHKTNQGFLALKIWKERSEETMWGISNIARSG
jgi:hypothetical protein